MFWNHLVKKNDYLEVATGGQILGGKERLRRAEGGKDERPETKQLGSFHGHI